MTQQKSELSLLTQIGWVFGGVIAIYLLVAAHFGLMVKASQILSRAKDALPLVGEQIVTETFIGEIVYFVPFVGWIILIIISLTGMFWAAKKLFNLLRLVLVESEVTARAVWKCFVTSFYCLLPVILLAGLTLAIMPAESPHAANEPTIADVGTEMVSADFVFLMTQQTLALFALDLLVVVVIAVFSLLSSRLPDGAFFTVASLVVGVLVGVTAAMPLMFYGNQGLEILRARIGNSYLTMFAVFAVYSFLSTALILPTLIKKNKFSGRRTVIA